jgi:DNA gyrase/topoisomerase IV subunit A
VRATTHIETISQRNRAPRSAIIVTQLPYMVNKAGLLEKIAAMVNDKKLDGMCVAFCLSCILSIPCVTVHEVSYFVHEICVVRVGYHY